MTDKPQPWMTDEQKTELGFFLIWHVGFGMIAAAMCMTFGWNGALAAAGYYIMHLIEEARHSPTRRDSAIDLDGTVEAMSEDFIGALDDAIDKYLESGGSMESVISALELKLMALKEEQENEVG